MPSEQIISLHPAAPEKPTVGASCNGCGVCCLQSPCPLGRLRFLQAQGACPALLWDTPGKRYHCGLLTAPARFFPVLPQALQTALPRLIRRWIAAGQGCDCTTVVLGDADV